MIITVFLEKSVKMYKGKMEVCCGRRGVIHNLCGLIITWSVFAWLTETCLIFLAPSPHDHKLMVSLTEGFLKLWGVENICLTLCKILVSLIFRGGSREGKVRRTKSQISNLIGFQTTTTNCQEFWRISVSCVCAYDNFKRKLCATYSFNHKLKVCLCAESVLGDSEKDFGWNLLMLNWALRMR